MTSTYFQRKRSERGASLLMLVSIIGLAFIVTVAAFLMAASNGQDTARLATAKVDIATREDALMRVILQQTATGLFPSPAPTWNTIMTNAVTQLRATTYVDPAELATLGLSAATLANMGDTGGSALGIFQGYQNTEVPFGGTSGVLSDVSLDVAAPYTPAVEPPLMGWWAGTTSAPLSSATALTTPQEFFLGSLYTSTSTPVTSDVYSKRWGQITYPNVRFGYKQPGNLFIARRVWWRIPLLYQTTQQALEDQVGVNRYPGALATYVLSVYEIPSQLPISGNANLQIGLNADGTAWGSGMVAGSIYGGQIQLASGNYTTLNSVSSRQQVTVQNTATVGGVSLNSNFDQLGTREQIDQAQTTIGASPLSVAGNDGKVLLVPVMAGNQFYMQAPLNAPTKWDLYARPYYKCRIRIIISGTTSALVYNSLTGVTIPTPAITVTLYYLPDNPSLPDSIFGFPDTAATKIVFPPSPWPDYLQYTSTRSTTTVPGSNVLRIDVKKMINELGLPGQLYSIYVGSNPTSEPGLSPSTSSDPGVAIWDTTDLHAVAGDPTTFTSGLSIVSNQTLYLDESFNQIPPNPPTSLYAPQVLYGIQLNPTNVTLTGQLSVDPASSATPIVNPLSLTNATVNSTSSLFEITDPNQIPPITRISLMFTIEKERTN